MPDLDSEEEVEDTSVRRRRQTEEMTSPLPPGHYRPQLFRYVTHEISVKRSFPCPPLFSYIAEEISVKSSLRSKSLFRYSETSKHFYLIDVDQRTLFSLQAVINDSVMVSLQIMISAQLFWFFK